jgi:hypothetical protein
MTIWILVMYLFQAAPGSFNQSILATYSSREACEQRLASLELYDSYHGYYCTSSVLK